jgi:hypothetical protein
MKFTHIASMVSLLIVGLGLAVNGYSQSFLTNGLVAYYPFNGNANDASGNGNNGVVYGPTVIADRFGNANSAYKFDGVDDYVRIAAAQSLNITGNLTISAWIRTTSSTHIIFSNMLQISPHNGYCLSLINGGYIAFTSGGMGLSGDTPVNMNVWTHVAITLFSTTATAYVNGVFDSSGTVGVPTSSGVDATIGASYTPYYFFTGLIDDIRIYNRALSDNEVAQLYDLEAPPRIGLIKAVKPLLSHMYVGTNYQLQVSADLNTWTNQGSPFTATNRNMVYPQYWDVDNWNSLFFRLQVSP